MAGDDPNPQGAVLRQGGLTVRSRLAPPASLKRTPISWIAVDADPASRRLRNWNAAFRSPLMSSPGVRGSGIRGIWITQFVSGAVEYVATARSAALRRWLARREPTRLLLPGL